VPGTRAIDDETVAARLEVVRQRIERAGGDRHTVQVLAVTKGFGVDAVGAAQRLGLEVGENYAQELVAKRDAFHQSSAEPLRWHFLGAIQTNKIAVLAPRVDCWESLSRPVEAERIARARPGATALVEVAFSEDPTRPGCPPAQVPELVASAGAAGLAVAGLMVVAPRGEGPARAAFRAVRGLADDLGLAVRSMGMTEDLELAVAEGSTLVRVGRGLFGDRPRSQGPGRGGESAPRG
jgi:PLP dependent protein